MEKSKFTKQFEVVQRKPIPLPQFLIIWISSTMQSAVLNLYSLPSNERVAEMFSIKMPILQAGLKLSPYEPSLELLVPSSPGFVDFLNP